MTTPFFDNINLGITSRCNAQCRFCNRMTFKDFPDMNQDMPRETVQKLYPHAGHLEFCGSFGDFINHSEGLQIARDAKAAGVSFNIETNAGIRSREYWIELAQICNSEKYHVQFSIDDIQHEINPYRKVRTETVLRNLRTFIDAGGYAVTKSILFEFNQNQPLEEFLKNIGVKKHLQQFSMIYDDELSAPTDCSYPDGTLVHLYKLGQHIRQKPKECPWKAGNWLYVLDNGEVHPCCYFVIFGAHLEDNMMPLEALTSPSEYGAVLEIYLRNKELININNVSLEDAYNNEYNAYVRENFQSIPRCIKRCSLNNLVKNPITGIL